MTSKTQNLVLAASIDTWDFDDLFELRNYAQDRMEHLTEDHRAASKREVEDAKRELEILKAQLAARQKGGE
jgi:polyhydroxyalkanoate synthesis regulator phasin